MSAIDPHAASLEALALTQEHARGVRDACDRIARWLEALNHPAIPDVFALSDTEPRQRSEHGVIARSITVLNPSPVSVYLGYSGGKATAEARAFPIGASSALTLPVLVEDYEIGADPADLVDGAAVVFVLRYETVQPFFVGSL